MNIKHSNDLNEPSTRSGTNGTLKELGMCKVSQATFINDSARAWNKAPNVIKECKSIYAVKKSTRTFVMSLPL